MRRLLVIAENPGLTPAHQPALSRRLREAGIRLVSLRVATRHVEVDLLAEHVEGALAALDAVGVRVKEVVDLSGGEGGEGLDKYVELFNAERFWEAHGALERAWRTTGDPALQGLIMLAAAFVKLQENRVDRFRELLRKALAMVDRDVGCIKAAELKRLAEEALASMKPFKVPCY